MRTTWRTPLILVLVSLPGALLAQDGDLFGKLDKNSDGQVAADEIDAERKNLFERLLRNGDKDKDGKLSKEEFTAVMTRRPAAENPPADRAEGAAAVVEAMFQRADSNGDGKLSKEEVPERLKARFADIDADSDGSLSKDELARALRRMSAGQPGAPGQPPRGEFAIGALVLKTLDADDDGTLSSSEIADASKALAKLDKDSDGKLDREELLAQAPHPAGGPGEGRPNPEAMARRLKEADKNGDGKLSKEETPPRLQRAFDRIDTNGDESLDQDEIRKFLRQARP